MRLVLRNLLGCKKYSRYLHRSTHSVTGATKPYAPRHENVINRKQIQQGPGLEHFIANQKINDRKILDARPRSAEPVPYLKEEDMLGHGRKVYFDVHGCQMNTNDTEIAWAILQQKGYTRTQDIAQADVILVMTCAIREGAEQKIRKKLHYLGKLKKRAPLRKGGTRIKIGILGCMAERLKQQLLDEEQMVDVVCGPDAYRDLPRLLAVTSNQQAAVNVILSLEETYADITPVRLDENNVSAYVSIMRGCDNMCSYCIVPFTRGRERSRPIRSILDEVRYLSDLGYKEITLLGQNVNSFRDTSEAAHYNDRISDGTPRLSEGFKTLYKPKVGGRRFSELLQQVAQTVPEVRIRFTAPHPKDFPDEVLQLICECPNICHQLHLPAQSGNNDVLADMRRGYTVEAYLQLVNRVRNIIPDVCLTSDMISGFCGETESAHGDTVELVRQVQYSMVYAYPYSMRQKTHAYHRLQDDVPEEVKQRRYLEILKVFREEAHKLYTNMIGQQHLVLVEGLSKKSSSHLFGRTDGGIGVVVPCTQIMDGDTSRDPKPGDFISVQILGATSHTLYGEALQLTSLLQYHNTCIAH